MEEPMIFGRTKFERALDRQGRTLYRPAISKWQMILEGAVITVFWIVAVAAFVVLAA